jgi:hypothetical protein
MAIETRENNHMNTVLAEKVIPSSQTLQLVQGDITAEMTDAIVNAADEHLWHRVGVAGAIVLLGGHWNQTLSIFLSQH